MKKVFGYFVIAAGILSVVYVLIGMSPVEKEHKDNISLQVVKIGNAQVKVEYDPEINHVDAINATTKLVDALGLQSGEHAIRITKEKSEGSDGPIFEKSCISFDDWRSSGCTNKEEGETESVTLDRASERWIKSNKDRFLNSLKPKPDLFAE